MPFAVVLVCPRKVTNGVHPFSREEAAVSNASRTKKPRASPQQGALGDDAVVVLDGATV